MTSPICEYLGVLQEWAPETRLLFQIPAKALRGIFSHDLKLTCIDVAEEFISLGTNCGLVYWYCRVTGELQRLRIENTSCSVTCVKIVSTVDFMLAAGTDGGNITVFQIPKKPPELLPEAMKPKSKQVERFSIDGLHKGGVTCLEWSPCGMKLFSADKTGIVVFTTIDYEMQISKSSGLLNEQFEVVQLSYYQNKLLVSTIYRTILCDGDASWRVVQLGSKERKSLGKYGATFCKFDHGTVIYASRPGQRLWLADKSGTVQQTLIFKSAVQSSHPKITLINPCMRKGELNRNFGKVVQFGENCLICYQAEILYILHPAAVTVIASLDCARNILDVAVNKDEIYILEGDRSLLRVAYAPDSFAKDLVEDITNRRRSYLFDDIANKIKDTAGSFKRITTELISSSEKVSPPALADEAIDLPPLTISPNAYSEPERNVEIHEPFEAANCKAGAIRRVAPNPKDDEEGLVIRPSQRRKRKQQQQGVGHESESDSMSTTSEDRLVCGYVNEPSVSEESSYSQTQSGFSILRDIHSLLPLTVQNSLKTLPETPKSPDDRSVVSLDTCESVSENLGFNADAFREEQEKTFIRLANQEASMMDSLNSDRTENMSISVNMTPSSSASSKLSDNIVSSEISENVSMISECDDPPQVQYLPQPQHSAETSSISSGNSQVKDNLNKEMILSQILGLDLDDPLNQFRSKSSESEQDGNLKTPIVEERNFPVDQKLQSLDSLCYGPPSGSSLLSSCQPSLDLNTGPAHLSNLQALAVDKSDCWLQYKTPDGVSSISVCNNYVVCTADLDHVFYSQLRGIALTWTILDYKSNAVAMSRDGNLVWLMGQNGVAGFVNQSPSGPFSEKMEPVESDVKSFTVDNYMGFYVGVDGKIKYQCKLIRTPTGVAKDLPCDWLVTSVMYRDGVLLAITCHESLICKPSLIDDFVSVSTPLIFVRSIAMGPGKLIWIVDETNNIYFSEDYLSPKPKWWEVLISEYIFHHSLEPFLNLHNRVKSSIVSALHLIKPTRIAANDSSVWVYKKGGSFVQVNKTSFTGYLWEDLALGLMLKLKIITAQGVFEEKGQIWLLTASNDLFYVAADAREKLHAVPNPSSSGITCISSAHDTMWVLSEQGTLYARLGLTDACFLGTDWRQLRLPELISERLVWVSCGCEVAWSLDVSGRIFMTPVPPYSIATNMFDAAWVQIEDTESTQKHALFTKVFTGPNAFMVWAVDSEEQIYVREGIVAGHQMGTGWVHVGGITAKYLSVSGTAVWALSTSGDIYRRYGISENNYIGDYWRRIPGKLNSLSATFNDDLWGVSTLSELTRLLQRKISFDTKQDETHNVSIEDDDLVVID